MYQGMRRVVQRAHDPAVPQPGEPRDDAGAETTERVLVVGDEEATATLLATALRYDGWEVELAGSVAAEAACSSFAPAAVLLDHTDLAVLQDLRAQHPELPVLLLSEPETATDTDALGDRTDQLTDWLPLTALCARLRGLLLEKGARRTGDADFAVGELILHADGVTARHRGTVIELSAGERWLLCSLMSRSGAALSRSQITAQLWQHDFGGRPDIVDLYVACLRDKIDLPGVPRLVQMHPDGYALVPRDGR